MIYKSGKQWVMYYYGANDSLRELGVGCATSPDLISWTECPGNPVSLPNISRGLIRPSILPENDYGTMLVNATGTSIYVARLY